ncbi:MAG: hypothetical protein J6M02_01980 [Clostridia bacterium]|nr:hypothetical protein [Clostridia bacterium]
MSDFAQKLIELAKKTTRSSGNIVISALKKDETLADRLLALIKSVYPEFDFAQDISYLGAGSAAVCLEIKDSSQHSIVLKIGMQNLRKGSPVKHKHLLSSMLEREIIDAEGNCVLTVVIQDRVKIYGETDMSGHEVCQMMNALISDGIIVCDMENPFSNVGRNDEGTLVVIDTETIFTKEELGEKWDDTCHQALFGAGVKRPADFHYLTKEQNAKEKVISTGSKNFLQR